MTADPALIATLMQLAEDNKDIAIADDLRALAIRAGQYPDMPSTAALQTGLGVAEQAVYRKLDRILKVCEDNGAVVTEAFAKAMDAEQAQIAQADRLESALTTIAGALQRQEVAVDDLRQGFRTMAEEVSNLTLASIEQEKFNRSVEGRVARVEAEIPAIKRRLVDLETYAAGVPDAERQELIATIQELRQNYRDILARLPQDALKRDGA